MKKTTQPLVLLFSVLMPLIVVTATPRTRSSPNPTVPIPGEVIGQIRWKKEMGLIPSGPGSKQASTSACSAFFIIAVSLGMGPSAPSEVHAHSDPSTKQPREDGEYYVCHLSMQLPLDKGLIATASLGDVNAWPRKSRESIYWTDPWIGGANSQPAAGLRRGFKDFAFVNRSAGSKPIFYRFEMIYVPTDYEPNFSSTSQKSSSPLLPAANFAGAWHGNLGGVLELILQQSRNQVTGLVKLNSAEIGVIRDGTVTGSTLRFKIVRPGRAFGNGTTQPEVFVGVGELVMDEGGKSFTGTVLGTATSGTFIGP
jgi:hypothetical protein